MIEFKLISGVAIDFLFIFIFCLVGAIVKDTYNTFTEKDQTVKITRILISSITSSIILLSLSEFILAKMSMKTFILPCFIGGMIGFEIVGKLNLIFWLKVLVRNKKDLVNELIEEEEVLKKKRKKKNKL